MFREMFTESVNEAYTVYEMDYSKIADEFKQGTGEKQFRTQSGIGKAKYTISMNDGIGTYKDGSPFFGIAIFSNKKKFEESRKAFIKAGYREL